MTGLLISDDGLKSFTESLKILDTTLGYPSITTPIDMLNHYLSKYF